MKVDGRCHCGKISYEAIVDPQSVAVCHCTDCQMLTGTAFRAGVSAAGESFQLTGVQPKIYVKTAQSGAKRAHAFCPDCGTPVYSAAVENPVSYTLRLGCLRQRAELRPQLQRWCGSALPWSMNIQDVPRREHQ